MRQPAPIYVVDRFPALRAQLVDLLSGLSADDWSRPTAAGLWTVKDIAVHLLGGDIGNLSRRRDAFRQSDKPFQSDREFVAFINELNAQWVTAARRMSPRILCELLAFTGPPIAAYFASLDPDAVGGPVSWAGPDPAPVWLDIAREFTEQWHHQQQIRDATGRPALYAPYFFAPVLDAFMRAVPHSFRKTAGSEGVVVRIDITGSAGGSWFLRRGATSWDLLIESDAEPSTEVAMPQDTVWRVFTRGIEETEARRLAIVRGDA
ncbi:MAG TPA: maleylpyruvate isomerase family mycothiol-dependent enzyme, partial [Bryobacteraceae bacterium]|nr:maleylpyruvate isomerase family mycothiol-dependent enzyme [Bryobacteraceae bacterium]